MDFQWNEKIVGRQQQLKIFWLLPTIFLLTGLVYGIWFEGIDALVLGLKEIMLAPTILLTDFLEVGGIGATLINVAIVGFINLFFIYKYDLKINGVLIAAFFTLIGFSFFGKNVYNILPIYVGGYLYAKYQRVSFKEVLIVMMFGTALSPLISEISFSGILHPVSAFIMALIMGIFIGFVIVPLSSHMMKFHDGFNLYNIGFTSGIIGTVVTSLLRSFGLVVEPVNIVSKENQWVIIGLVIFVIAILFVIAFYLNPKALAQLKLTFRYKGRLVTDFTYLVGYGVTCLNMAIIGLGSLAYVLAIGGVVNGPVLAGIFTVMGFGAFGKQLRNIIPVMAGVIATAMFFDYDLSATGIIISILFSTTQAPIAGSYGGVIGFIAGVMHMILVTNVGIIHGGINLYNNGFSGGIVAGVLIPVVDAFRKERA